MSVKDEILQRKRAQRVHARGLTDQVRPERPPAPTLPENEDELDDATRRPAVIDAAAVYARFNAPKKRKAQGDE
jgi:hypothetical protein